jgi:hypothetical protein
MNAQFHTKLGIFLLECILICHFEEGDPNDSEQAKQITFVAHGNCSRYVMAPVPRNDNNLFIWSQ